VPAGGRGPDHRRRRLLAAIAGAPWAAAAATDYARVTRRALEFPADHGAHPDYRIEWWYLTALLDTVGDGQPIGLQVTFFRLRTPIDPANPSRFAARQLVFAHAAIADPTRGALVHEERIEREGFGVDAATGETRIALDAWRFERRPSDGSYAARIAGRTLRIDLAARPTQPLLLQGDHGYSLKGDPADGAGASDYYSQPQLACDATVEVGDRRLRLAGRGWLDHEWSSALLPPGAAGWDWTGVNLDDGGALTAFRIRNPDGSTRASYASLRASGGEVETFGSEAVRFEPLQAWESPRTRGRYPIAQRVTVGSRQFETRPLMADQELDSRTASGAVYWEGASRVFEAGRQAGRGYLELTGYAGRAQA